MNLFQNNYWGTGRGGISQGVKALLIANGIIYVSQLFAGSFLVPLFGLVPKWAWSKLYLWQFGTYLFLHGGILHLVFNMYSLWLFGCEVERVWGTKAFLKYYFITGIGAGLIHMLITPFSTVPTIGASGAIMGVLTAFALMFPESEITLLLFFILPVRLKARTLVLFFAAISLLGGVLGSPDKIAHFAHLGGMAVGYVCLKHGWSLTLLKKRYFQWKRGQQMQMLAKEREDMENLRSRVDQILDKANEIGMDNLSRHERIVLKRASRMMKQEKKRD